MNLTKDEELLVLAYRELKEEMTNPFCVFENSTACVNEFTKFGRKLQCHVIVTRNQDDFIDEIFEPKKLTPSVSE